MNIRRWATKRALLQVSCGTVLLPLLIGFGSLTSGDHPTHDITVKLGPGNEDFEAKLKDSQGFSDAPAAFERARGFDMSGRDLRGAQLHLFEFTLPGINFSGADFTGADIDETVFEDCSFRNAILRRVRISSAWYLKPTCDLSGADISGSYIAVTKEHLASTRNYKEKDLSFTKLQLGLGGLSLAGFNLRGSFIHAHVGGLASDMTNADISDCTISLTKEQLLSTKNYKQRRLDGIDFFGCDFRGVDFSRQNLPLFRGCKLEGADFSDAAFVAIPPGIGSQIIPGRGSPILTRRSGFDRSQLTPEQFYSTRTYKSGRIPPSTFARMDLRGWDFSGMDLRNVGFSECSFDEAVLENARGGIFQRPKGLTPEQVQSTWNYQYWKMNEAGFSVPEELNQRISDVK